MAWQELLTIRHSLVPFCCAERTCWTAMPEVLLLGSLPGSVVDIMLSYDGLLPAWVSSISLLSFYSSQTTSTLIGTNWLPLLTIQAKRRFFESDIHRTYHYTCLPQHTHALSYTQGRDRERQTVSEWECESVSEWVCVCVCVIFLCVCVISRIT